MNGTIGFLDHKNIGQDTKSALVQKLRAKMYFCKMVANVIYWCKSHVQTTQGILIHLNTLTQATLCKKNWQLCPLVSEIWPKM